MAQPILSEQTTPPAICCWSGGKDAAFALYKTLQGGMFDIKYLLTTFHATHRRVSMHGVPEALIEQQAASIGIPLLKMYLEDTDNTAYERQLETSLLRARDEGIRHVLFGDIFLEDLRRYREQNLAKIGMQAVFPLWKSNTKKLAGDFIEAGFKTITCCVNASKLNRSWAGRRLNAAFLRDLPPSIDPCGEHGEYHTFCFDGPIFSSPVWIKTGETVYRTYAATRQDENENAPFVPEAGFWFCDLLSDA